MTNEHDEILMSQLADGELPSDQANELLLGVLNDADKRRELKEHLRLRKSLGQWRRQKPARPIVALSAGHEARPRYASLFRRLGSLAAAAVIGGVLVLAGFWTADRINPVEQKGRGDLRVAAVTDEQMRQVASVFALHESVAGPLAWYAADDQNIQLASARGAEVSQAPIGVLLKLESATPGAIVRTLVIVCRNDQPAVIELPAESSDQAGLRVYLTPRTSNGKVDVQYTIAVNGQSQQAPLASFSGQRRLGLSEAPLGQLAMGDKLLNVDAAAWPMRQERK